MSRRLSIRFEAEAEISEAARSVARASGLRDYHDAGETLALRCGGAAGIRHARRNPKP